MRKGDKNIIQIYFTQIGINQFYIEYN